MNHTINEIAAGLDRHFNQEGLDIVKYRYEWEQAFAETLIFECIKIAVFRGDSATAKAIKEHFGVE